MPSLAYVMPQKQNCPHGTYHDVIIENKGVLRTVYSNGSKRFLKRAKIKRLLRGFSVFDNLSAECFRAEKIRRDGTSLALANADKIIRFVSRSSPVIIITCEFEDLIMLGDTIKSLKRVQILTTPEKAEEFDSFLMNAYGMAGAVCCAALTDGKTQIVLPSGSNFDTAKNAINLCESDEVCKCVRFKAPSVFKGAEAALRECDALETALSFFDIDYSEAELVSVKLNRL